MSRAAALLLAAAFFLMGFGLKAALVPFHAWLPDAVEQLYVAKRGGRNRVEPQPVRRQEHHSKQP